MAAPRCRRKWPGAYHLLFREISPPERADYDLTSHESRPLKLLVKGHNYKRRSRVGGDETHSASFHLRRIHEKLQVHSKTEAVAKALQNRLI